MRSRLLVGSGVAACAAGAVLLASVGGALGGHTNTVLHAQLDGREEVRTGAEDNRVVGDPNGRGEAYVFGIDGDPTTLCYVLTVAKIAPATAAHIHEAPAGVNGPIVVNLAAPADGDAADCVSESEGGAFPTGETAAEILSNPSGYYVNVHNGDYPGGAIRGQLAANE